MLCGGKRHGAIYEATLLENVPWDCNIIQNEAFGPVACLFPYDSFKKAVDMCVSFNQLRCAACALSVGIGGVRHLGRQHI